jgi:phosphoglycolate phosphatase-like HAD superfamily hydrolase
MQNGPEAIMNVHQANRAASFAARGNRSRSSSARPESNVGQGAKRSYERYLALARAETQAGNVIEAENYYQHAEHFFRSMGIDVN